MKHAMLLLTALVLAGCVAWAQDVPPIVPCGLGQAGNVPCYDTKTGKVIHTGPHMALPHQNLTKPLPSGASTSGKVTVPKIQAPSVTPPAPLAQVPYWTFKADEAYYHDDGETKSVGIGSLQSMIQTPNPAQDFASGEAVGAVAGGIVGGLISRWLAHRRRLKLERMNLKEQIVAYYDATYRLDQEQREALRSIDANEIALSRIDPARRDLYLRAEEGSTPWNASLAKLDSMLAKSRPVIQAAKDTGFLRNMLVQAREFYDLELEYAKKLYAFSQLSGVLLGYREWQQSHGH